MAFAPPEFVAHRAGNLLATIDVASRIADTIEIDVHLFRGRLEVRHAKVLWPTRIQWEPWEIIPPGARPPSLADVLAAIPEGTGVWLDLKGCSPRLARLVENTIVGVDGVTVSSRCWWILRAFRHRDGTRTMRSVGSRWQLFSVVRLGRWERDDGVVVHQRLISPEIAERLLAMTPLVFAWAVVDVMRGTDLIRLGLRGLILDDLELVAEIRRAVGDV